METVTLEDCALSEVGSDWVRVATPYLDRHNDCLQFYVRREGDGYLLIDDGDTLNDLMISGIPLNSPKLHKMLRTTLAELDVQTDGEQLMLRATPENFPQKAQHFIQAMLAVNDV